MIPCHICGTMNCDDPVCRAAERYESEPLDPREPYPDDPEEEEDGNDYDECA